jgi:hypothetical protein
MVGENGTVPFAAVYHRNTSKSTKIFTGPILLHLYLPVRD